MADALMLDVYGTVVHEDGPVIAGICERVAAVSGSQRNSTQPFNR